MKKILTAITVAVFIIYPSICFASYVIHLKDGREFVTDRYWEEGEQIKFKRYGGVIGIEKGLVKEIEDLEDEKKEAKAETAADQAEDCEKSEIEIAENAGTGAQRVPSELQKARGKKQTEEKEKPEEVSEEEKKKAEQEKVAKIEAFLEEKRRILEERETASSAFKEAKARNDRRKKDEYWSKLLFLQKELARLRKQVKAEHSGKLPYWWDSLR